MLQDSGRGTSACRVWLWQCFLVTALGAARHREHTDRHSCTVALLGPHHSNTEYREGLCAEGLCVTYLSSELNAMDK